MTNDGDIKNLKFHRDFGESVECLHSSSRFVTALNFSSLIYKSNSLCTWIPKAGCSNLRYSVALANGLLDETHSIHWIHNNNQTFRPSIRDCFDVDYSFIFLRCPMERIVSAFLDKLIDSVNADLFRAKFSKMLGQDCIEKFFSFSDFIKLIADTGFSDDHWRAQSEFLVFNTYSDYFNLNDFHQAKETLKKRIDFDLHDTRSMLKHDTSHYLKANVFKAYDLSIAEIQDLKSRGIVPSRESFLNEEIAEMIKNHWRSDFGLYQRHFEAPKIWVDLGVNL